MRTTSMVVAGGMVVPFSACSPHVLPGLVEDPGVRKNWAGNYTYRAERLYRPESVEAVQELVMELGKQKALGSRHCFNNIADSPESQVSTAGLNQLLELDEAANTVTVGAGARYGDFAEGL
ncbi:MAG: FAD-binding protein, partial [Lewinella sp.]